jgi:F-type H+-transporting ATPase subunit epsilon
MAIPTHLRLEFVTPERSIAHEDVDEVELPGEEGFFGVLPGHAPLLASLRTGEMRAARRSTPSLPEDSPR